jgi:hypothetical protein
MKEYLRGYCTLMKLYQSPVEVTIKTRVSRGETYSWTYYRQTDQSFITKIKLKFQGLKH